MKFLSCFACLLSVLTLSAQVPEFGSVVTAFYDSGDSPNNLEIADVTGDGQNELIFTRTGTDELVMVNYDDGSWTDPVVLITDFPAVALFELGDLEGDGDVDIAIRLSDSQVFQAFYNDGAGTFGDATYVGTGSTIPRDMQLGDVDNDGDLDLVSSHWSAWEGPSIQWYRNNGPGSSWTNFNLSTAWNWEDLDLGDIDSDGDLDLLVAQYNDDVYLFENYGSGFSSGAVILSGDGGLRSLHVEDFNGDGDQDLFAGWYGTNGPVLWYESDGDMSTLVEHQMAYHNGALYNAFPADLDGDGDMDLVTSSGWYEYDIGYLENRGGGEFGSHYGLNYLVDDGNVEHVAIADLTGDGYPEIAYITQYNSRVKVALNQSWKGCTDPASCNYDPNALIDEPCYDVCECYDWNALNHDKGASNSAACLYEMTGYVFHDANGNGYHSTDEPKLASQGIDLYPLNMTIYTDDNGDFTAILPRGVTDLTVQTTDELNVATNNGWVYNSAHLNDPYTHDFGLGSLTPLTQVEVSVHEAGATSLCDALFHHFVVVENSGTQALTGSVTLTYDDQFQGYEEMSPIDAVAGNALTWNFEDLGGGQSLVFNVRLHTPTVAFIGESYTHEVSVDAQDADAAPATVSNSLEGIVSCAYDPNDKLVTPLGYGDDHLLPAGELQEFVVRFQNTGNATATDIVVRDTLDTHWDLDSFEILGHSHSAHISIDHTTREVVYTFENIMLPDSNCCEPFSHGMLSYSLRSLPALESGTRLENTAYIYFDNNPAIVTNTTWTTIHNCQTSISVEAEGFSDCQGVEIVANTTYDTADYWEEDWLWTYEGEEVGNSPVLFWPVDMPIDGTLSISVSNPLCEHTAQTPITFTPTPTETSCEGDLNCDGDIGALDVLAFLSEWNCTGITCRYDLDQNLTSDSADLLLLLGLYGTSCD